MDKNETGLSNEAFHPLKKGNGEGARSKDSTERLHQTSPRVSKSTTALSSHFYQGPTTFGGRSSYNRCLSALLLAKKSQHTFGRVLKFGERSMVRPGPFDKGQVSKPVETPPDLKSLKRRRLYAVNKNSQDMMRHQSNVTSRTLEHSCTESPKEEKSLKSEDLQPIHSEDSLAIKPQGQRFSFTKPISLKTFKLKRSYIFSPPIFLK